jgi:hypothetical protein
VAKLQLDLQQTTRIVTTLTPLLTRQLLKFATALMTTAMDKLTKAFQPQLLI